jgi:hypothetical protein
VEGARELMFGIQASEDHKKTLATPTREESERLRYRVNNSYNVPRPFPPKLNPKDATAAP